MRINTIKAIEAPMAIAVVVSVVGEMGVVGEVGVEGEVVREVGEVLVERGNDVVTTVEDCCCDDGSVCV